MNITRKIRRALRGKVGLRAVSLEAGRRVCVALRRRRERASLGRRDSRGAEEDAHAPRLADADPKGRNAGWTAYVYYSFDEALPQDARQFAPVRGRSDLFSGNIQYKLNEWVTFAFEQGYYRTRAANHSASDFGGLPLFRGVPSYTSHNVRSEFATIFTF